MLRRGVHLEVRSTANHLSFLGFENAKKRALVGSMLFERHTNKNLMPQRALLGRPLIMRVAKNRQQKRFRTRLVVNWVSELFELASHSFENIITQSELIV
jgi:hypothetical protein